MKNQFTLSIENPCGEDFNHFEPTKLGSFCNTCQKEVIDFTEMTDKEIIQYFQSKKEQQNTCGKFISTQLKAYNNLKQPARNRFAFLRVGLLGASLATLLSMGETKAQSKEAVKVAQHDHINNGVLKRKKADLAVAMFEDNASEPAGECRRFA